MTTPTRRSLRARRLFTISMLAAAIAGVGSTSAWASANEEQQGAALLQQVQSGKTSCGKLTASQSELIGESVMGRMLGSTTAHNAMNAQITAMMGTRGEQQAHQFMGQRFVGCTTGKAPAAFGAMMGTMGAGMMGASQGYGANMYRGNAAGGMMGDGNGPSQTAHGSDMSTGAILAIVLGSIALLAVIIVVAVRRITRRPTAPPTA